MKVKFDYISQLHLFSGSTLLLDVDLAPLKRRYQLRFSWEKPRLTRVYGKGK